MWPCNEPVTHSGLPQLNDHWGRLKLTLWPWEQELNKWMNGRFFIARSLFAIANQTTKPSGQGFLQAFFCLVHRLKNTNRSGMNNCRKVVIIEVKIPEWLRWTRSSISCHCDAALTSLFPLQASCTVSHQLIISHSGILPLSCTSVVTFTYWNSSLLAPYLLLHLLFLLPCRQHASHSPVAAELSLTGTSSVTTTTSSATPGIQ